MSQSLVLPVAALFDHVRDHKLPGKVFTDPGFVLGLRRDPERMRQPDVVYVEKTRLGAHDPERIFRGIPDLVCVPERRCHQPLVERFEHHGMLAAVDEEP